MSEHAWSVWLKVLERSKIATASVEQFVFPHCLAGLSASETALESGRVIILKTKRGFREASITCGLGQVQCDVAESISRSDLFRPELSLAVSLMRVPPVSLEWLPWLLSDDAPREEVMMASSTLEAALDEEALEGLEGFAVGGRPDSGSSG